MSTALTLPEEILALQRSQQSEGLGDLAVAGDFLPYIKVCGGQTDEVKRGKLTMGVFGLYGKEDQPKELGKRLIVVPILYRAMAIDVGTSPPRASYNQASPLFLDIKTKSSEKSPNGDKLYPKCLYGPQFLVWLPEQKMFVTFYLNNWSSRKRAPELVRLLNKSTLLEIYLEEANGNSWHTFSTAESNVPFEAPESQLFAKTVRDFITLPPDTVTPKAAQLTAPVER